MTEPKVLFIIGKGRSGSTLLDNVLGQLEGFFSAGEIWRRWQRRPLDEYQCGCGLAVRECPIWSRALDLALGRLASEFGSSVSTSDILKWEQEVLRWHRVRRLLLQKPGELGGWPELDSLTRAARALYHAIAAAANARVIVDSTKWPANPGPLDLVPGIRSYVVHLVRDPRAVAFSWQRLKPSHAFGKPMPTFGAVSSSASWVARNLIAEITRRRMGDRALQIRYEDLVEEPRPTVESVIELVGENLLKLPFQDNRTALLGTSHTILGNPSRFVTGAVRIRHDDEWMARLSTMDSAIATSLTFPLLWLYRYPLLARKGSDRQRSKR